LCTIISPLLDVKTSLEETASWFEGLIFDNDAFKSSSNNAEPSRGVLVKLKNSQQVKATHKTFDVTEVLFFAVDTFSNKDGNASNSHGTLQLRAFLLSSKLLPTNPTSSTVSEPTTLVNDVLVSKSDKSPAFAEKRQRLSDTFDEASKRRRYSKSNLGNSISAAAATISTYSKPFTPLPGPPLVQTSELTSNDDKRPIPTSKSNIVSRSLSLQSTVSPVITSPNPPTLISTVNKANDLEQRNKDLLVRLTLSSMRLHGLVQPKPSSFSKQVETSSSNSNGNVEKEDPSTFKQIYHAVHRAVLFIFREHVAKTQLKDHMNVVQDTVERMLVSFTGDPLALDPTMGQFVGLESSGMIDDRS